MTVHEETGRTPEEALEAGLQKLAIPREYVLLEVLEEGGKGFLGLGGRQSRVRLTVTPAGERLITGRRALEEVLGAMGVSAQIRAEEVQGLIRFELSGTDSALLIGKHGQTLEALQFLLVRIVGRQVGERVQVQVDVEGYRERRREQLEQMALRLAEKVKVTRDPVTLEPMSPADRRTVHLALQHDALVRTTSVGDSSLRRVVIAPVAR
ncbi:MAG: RNA-binding cell elongation regulator Jag/EloR [Candidatus Methylomirabilia bacterium]